MSSQGNQATSFKRHYNPAVVKEHIGPGTEQRVYYFENGYGASVIPEYEPAYNGWEDPTSWARAVIPNCLELGVLRHTPSTDPQNGHNWALCYDSPVSPSDAVLRRLTPTEIDVLLDQIAGL